MTRAEFMGRLRRGLVGMPTVAAAEIASDYEMHFEDGAAAGRTEAEVAVALGDPDRLAREIRAESTMTRWREERSPGAAAAAVFAVLGLGAIDILILLPVLMGIGAAIIGFAVAVIVAFIFGAITFAAGPFFDPPGGPVTAVLGGIGFMAGAASAGAILTIISIGLMNALVWYGRLHYRLLKPALES
jgi:uncharacterized membrane protein